MHTSSPHPPFKNITGTWWGFFGKLKKRYLSQKSWSSASKGTKWPRTFAFNFKYIFKWNYFIRKCALGKWRRYRRADSRNLSSGMRMADPNKARSLIPMHGSISSAPCSLGGFGSLPLRHIYYGVIIYQLAVKNPIEVIFKIFSWLEKIVVIFLKHSRSICTLFKIFSCLEKNYDCFFNAFSKFMYII